MLRALHLVTLRAASVHRLGFFNTAILPQNLFISSNKAGNGT
jgi:hypothetical protein